MPRAPELQLERQPTRHGTAHFPGETRRPPLRRSRYEKAEALDTQQATRDMQAMSKARLLAPVGQIKDRSRARTTEPRA